MTSKFYWKPLISLLLCLVLTKATFVSHTYKLPKQQSEGSNVVSLDKIDLDDTAFDIRYQTSCDGCKCFVDSPVLTSQRQTDSSFSSGITQSFITKGRLYLLHSSSSSAISYSVFDVSPPSTLTKIVQEKTIPSYSGFKNIIFSPDGNSFVGYSSGKLVINTVDQQGNINENSYQNSNPKIPNSEAILDMAYSSDGLVFLARGEKGLEILIIKNSNLDSILLSLGDLEVNEGFQVTKLEVDYRNKILYVYDANSDQDSVLALDYSNKDEISLIDNYELGIKQISHLLVSGNKLLVTNKQDEKYNYAEFLRTANEKYEKPETIKLWEISQKIKGIQRNDENIVIDADDYLYIFKKDLPYETESSQLVIDIVSKEEGGTFFLVTKGDTRYLLKVASLQVSLLSIQQRPKPSLTCGTYKNPSKYTADVPFTVEVYRDSCTDAPTKSADNVCLDRYTFDIGFTGNIFTEFDSTAFAIVPSPVTLSNYIPTNNGTFVSHPGSTGGDNGGILTPIKKPDLIDPDAPYYDRVNNVYALVIVGVIVLTCFGCVVKCLVDFVRNSKARLSDQFGHQQLEEEEEYDEEGGEGDTKPESASQEIRVGPTDEESEEQE